MACTSSRRTLSTHNLKYEVFLSFRGADTRHGFTSHLHDAFRRLGILVFRDDDKLEKGEEIHPYLRKAIKRSQNAVVIISKKFAESKSCLFELSVIMKRKRKGHLNVFPVFYHVDPSDVRNRSGKFGKYFARLQKKEGSKVDIAEWEKWKAALTQVGDCPVDSSKDGEDPLELCEGVLKEVGNLCGWHIQNRYESEVIKEISMKVWNRLIHNSTDIDKSLVGIESPTKEIMELLHLELGGIRYVGICGMGGIGKTTLAQVICQIASPKFEAYCFIHGIREKEEDRLVELKKQLISAILSKDVADSLTNNKYEVDKVLMSRLKNKKVLIVLDDVWQRKQLDALAKAEWFGEGSRIIITSRSHDWPCLNKDNIYEVKTLNYGAALQLFCSKAFPKCHPKKKFQRLIKVMVDLAKGHPLALEVSGSYLSNKGKDDWEGYMEQLKANPDHEVKVSLQITFDRMKGQDQLRDAFLDIVCFFSDVWSIDGWGYQDRDHLLKKLIWLGYPSNILTDLENKSLVKFSKNEMMFEKGKLFIHDLLVQMGQEIADQERLWHQQDFASILQENPRRIEIDKLKVFKLRHPRFRAQKFCFGAFSEMKNLRIIWIFDNFPFVLLKWCEEYSELKLSNELRSLRWKKYPFESLPTGFNPTNLIELKLIDSSIKRLWDGNGCFSKLTDINLSGSKALKETPDLSQVPNLEILNLSFCTNLSLIHPSIGLLEQLKELICMHCKSLQQLPNRIISKSLEVLNLCNCLELKGLPNEIYLKSLKDVDLSHCSKLKNLSVILGTLPSLPYVSIDGAPVKEFPFLFQRLPFLEKFSAKGTHIGEFLINIFFSKEERVLTIAFYDLDTNLSLSPSLLSSLKCQILHGCIPSDDIESRDLSVLSMGSYEGHRELLEVLFSSLKSLLSVELINCNLEAIPYSICHWSVSRLDLSENRFMKLPNSMRELSNLKELVLSDCTSLRALPQLPLSLHHLELRNCPSLEFESPTCGVIPNSIGCWSSIKTLDLSNNKFMELPDGMCQLSNLEQLGLNDCTSLRALPKLPLSLESLELENCPLLWSSVCSSIVTYIGFDCKRHKILNLHPQDPRYIMPADDQKVWYGIELAVACGPTLGSRIPEWFMHRSTSSNKTIQICMDWNSANDSPSSANDSPDACALLIVYELYGHDKRKSRKRKFNQPENSDTSACKGSNHIFPEFVCQLRGKEDSPQQTFVIRVPEVVGTHGVWVFIRIPDSLHGSNLKEEKSYLASITASSENVELKESAARLLGKDSESEFCEVVSYVSRPGLDSKSIDDSLNNRLRIMCPIKPINSPQLLGLIG